MNARGYRRIIEKQQKRNAREERRAERRENLKRGVRTFALIAAGTAAAAGGRKLVQSGKLNKVFTSKALKNLVDDGRAISDFVGGMNKAITSTYRSKGLGIFTQDTSASLSQNLRRYLGKYVDDVGDIGSSGLQGINLLGQRRRLMGQFWDNEVSKMQVNYTKGIIGKYATSKSGDKTNQAVEFLNQILDKEYKSIFINGGKKEAQGSDFQNITHQNLKRIIDIYKEKQDVSGFADELEDILKNTVGTDNAFLVGKGKTAQETFIKKVVNNNKALKKELDEKTRNFARNTIYDLRDAIKQENSKTGKLFDDAGLEKLTFKDIMDDPDLLKSQNYKKHGSGFDPVKELENMKEFLSKEEYDEFLNTAVDTSILKNNKGGFTDFRHIGETRNNLLNWLGDNVEIPYVKIKPLKYLSMLDPSVNRAGVMGYTFARGTFMDTLTGSATALTDDMYLMGNTVRDSYGNIVKQNQTLVANSPHDVIGNVVRRMSGRNVRKDSDNLFSRITDIGRQNQSSVFDKWLNKRRQISDPLSFRNMYEDYVANKDFDYSQASDYELDRISHFFNEAWSGGRKGLHTMDSSTIKQFNPYDHSLNAGAIFESEDLEDLYRALSSSNDPQEIVEEFLSGKDTGTYFRNKIFKHIDGANGRAVNYQSAVRDMQYEFFDIIGSGNINTQTDRLFSRGDISGFEVENLRKYAAVTDIGAIVNSGTRRDIKNKWVLAEDYLNTLNDGSVGRDLMDDLYQKSKSWDFEMSYDNAMDPFEGNQFISINKSSGMIESINNAIKDGQYGSGILENAFGVVGSKFGEMGFGTKGFRAGRDAMDKVSSTSAISHFYFSRLSDGLSSIGLGLGSESMGSAQDVAVNLYLKRILLPAATIAGIGYINYKIGDITGTEPSDALAGTYARMTMDVQAVKDFIGINDISQKWEHVLSGSEHTFENPVGIAIKTATFGIVGDNSGYEEKKWYYERGDEEIRKGRFWPIGSNSPIYGGRVEYYRPSWYRRTIGDPKYTDVLWGSKEEYWENHWLPTLDNPIGPLKKILDPYHWENKHREDRPFVQSGGIQELQGIPIVGPMLDGTVGRIIKPVRTNREFKSSHKEMLQDINNDITNQYYSEVQGGYSKFSGTSSRVTSIENPYGGYVGIPLDSNIDIINDDIRDVFSYGFHNAVGSMNLPGGAEKWMFTGGYVNGPAMSDDGVQSNNYGVVPGYGAGSAANAVNAQLTQINAAVSKKAIKPSSSIDIDMVRDDFFMGDISSVGDPSAIGIRLSDTYRSMTEVGGIYGFGAEMLFGEGYKGTVLQDSGWAFSPNRQFWDQGLGGAGGGLSEIMRRFIPNNFHKDVYNPIRNEMPEWLPSYDSYFMDFLHGDPYSKITNGEERLPGAGYEAINKLNSDPYFGRYGALDRMKILGDVAPWSPQYQYYSKATTMLYQKGVYNDEQYEIAKRTREQVRNKKQKYDFQNYKFRDDDVDYQNVTINTLNSDFTFTTDQNPGQVFKIAGVNIPGANSETGEEVRKYLEEVIHGGAKVRIAVAEDGLNYRGSDIKNSVKAAVFINGESLADTLIRKYGAEGRYDDTDAATVHSLYSSTERAVGSVWETVTHLDLPVINKFMRNRSAVEEYERSIVYGKEFQDWKHPIRDWVKPTVSKIASQNPVVATATGMIIGSVLNKPGTGFKGRFTSMPALILGTASGLIASGRVVGETLHKINGNTDYAWIPEATQRRREVNEYFDKLRYVKFRGLYEKAKELAEEYEDMDFEELEEKMNETPYINKRLRKRLEKIKTQIAISAVDGGNIDEQEAQEKTQMINDFINGGSEEDRVQYLGTYTRLALQYKKEYESTLYGADPHGDFMSLYAALPKEDRPFFQQFMIASPRERKRILELVPENQKRFYKAKWGMKGDHDKKENLYDYFAKYGLPDEDWEGWEAGESLEKVKAKTVVKLHEDPSSYGYYDEDVQASRTAPSLGNDIQAGPIQRFRKNQLKRVLKGNGLKDVEIFQVGSFVKNERHQTRIDVDIKNNVKREMENAYYMNIGNYV